MFPKLLAIINTIFHCLLIRKKIIAVIFSSEEEMYYEILCVK